MAYFYYHVAPPDEQPRPERFDANDEDASEAAVIIALTWGEHLPPDYLR